jgi:hypothetical protein
MYLESPLQAGPNELGRQGDSKPKSIIGKYGQGYGEGHTPADQG